MEFGKAAAGVMSVNIAAYVSSVSLFRRTAITYEYSVALTVAFTASFHYRRAI
jgi:hypothetical protein